MKVSGYFCFCMKKEEAIDNKESHVMLSNRKLSLKYVNLFALTAFHNLSCCFSTIGDMGI